jgi:phosphatidylinositol kinase/protein kinase (PI-3  family)
MSHKQTQLTLKEARDAWKSERDNKKCIDAFLKVRKRFGPVMRHFFAERYKGAGDWFSTRLNYSRSVAVTSIAGHILGLGDRHIGNILLDYSTGEVVHIDLGIAFEQVRHIHLTYYWELIDIYS